MRKTITKALVSGCIALLTLMASPAVFEAQAEDPIATVLDASDVQEGYFGTWRLTIDLMGRELIMFLKIADVDGKLGATLDSANQPEPLAITEILKTEEGLDLNSELKFGGSFTIDIMLKVHLEGDGLGGSIADKGGIFSSDIVGTLATTEDLDAVQGRRPAPTEARLRIPGGKIIRIAFADLEVGSSDWDLFQDVEEGQVYKFTLSRATKIYTDTDLAFGDIVVKAENVAPDYPGVYSLWLRKVGDGWTLVFNEQSDIWGTRYSAEYDAAEVPLTVTKLEGDPQEKFLVRIEGEDGKGTLYMSWGDTQWSADFSLAQ